MTLHPCPQRCPKGYKQTHLPFSQANRFLSASHDRQNKSSHKPQSRRRPILPLEHTRTLTTAITSAPSVQRTLRDERGASGRVGHVGQYSTWDASRNGQPTRAQQRRDNKPKTERRPHRGNGVVQDAICQRTFCQRISTAGVRRSWTLVPHLVYPRFHVDRLVRDHGSFPSLVHTPVVRRAMLGPVRPVA